MIRYERSTLQKLGIERRFRTGAQFLLMCAIGYGVIYSSNSDRIQQDVESHQRIQASGTVEDHGGLSINGTQVDYQVPGGQVNLSLSDFTDTNTNMFRVRTTRTFRHPLDHVLYEMEIGGNTVYEEESFRQSAPIETQEEVIGGNMNLRSITLKAGEDIYKVNFIDN